MITVTLILLFGALACGVACAFNKYPPVSGGIGICALSLAALLQALGK